MTSLKNKEITYKSTALSLIKKLRYKENRLNY